MSLVALALLLVVVAVPTALVTAVLWLTGRTHAPDPGSSTGLVRKNAQRHETTVFLAAAGVGAIVAVVLLAAPVSDGDTSPRLGGAAPFAGAAAFAAVRAVGELTWPRPRASRRLAPLARRGVRSVGGNRLTLLLATAVVATLSVVAFGFTASTDGTTIDAPAVPGTTSTSGPYPGWPYGVPVLVALGLALLATAGALRLVARRRPLDGLTVAQDDALRRTSAARLLGGVQLGVGGGIAALDLFTGLVLHGAGWPLPAAASATVGLVVGVASVTAFVTSLAARDTRPTPLAPAPVGAV
ncbi:hypothetical protein [Luteimicrobium subarcticum]|uniref:Uncharacterized protein n=1 Tax=Luteimicrobium subarcticum TaxID=620910 RepID=A0A2M8W3E2_9MICO|nr:hypothetical protein [Luteimicrobium subarcticum]PJI85452.1 hypothetical protein CLV34_2964 [Luteimicrobium subarcticum]